jgi:hypothetical protein
MTNQNINAMENNPEHLANQVQKLKVHRNVSLLLLLITGTLFAITSNVLYHRISATTLVSVVEQNLPNHGLIRSVVYIPYEAARGQEALVSANEGDSQAVQAARVASVPKGGSLIINFNARKSGVVGTESWTYVVTDESGQELYRRRGLPSIAGSAGKDGLYNYDELLIPVKLPETFRVKIISRDNAQNIYQIKTNKVALSSLFR